VLIWDVETGLMAVRLPAMPGEVCAIAFSPDSRYLVWPGEDETVKVWDVQASKEASPIPIRISNIQRMAFGGPSGRFLVISSGGCDQTGHFRAGGVQVWDFFAARAIKTLVTETGSFSGVAFSPNGRWLAVGSWDHAIRLWNTNSWEEKPALHGHSKAVVDVAFTPDSRRLASASSDETVKIWDFETHEELLTLHGHKGGVNSVAFTADGWRLASAGNDSMIRIWDATPLNQEILDHREALSLVKLICRKPCTQEELGARIRTDQTISESVREEALALAGPYWENETRHQADVYVARLIDKAKPKAAILEKIRTDSSLTDAVRKQALILAEKDQQPQR
jgi:WD40 repeat protein